MKNKYLKSPFFLIIIFAFSMTYGQKSGSPWTKTTKNSITQARLIPQNTAPEKASYYKLDMDVLNAKLQNAPQRDSGTLSKIFLDFPNADGTMDNFRIMEFSVMHPELQAKFPEIRSYVGYGMEDSSNVIYFSVSPDGLHTMTMSIDKGTEFINPYTTDGAYEAFSKKDIPVLQNFFECGVIDDGISNKNEVQMALSAARNANDGMRRTYRLAVGTSLEYTDYHGGTVASALAAINTTMTRVNAIYDKELSIRMTLVANNDLLISSEEDSIFPNDDAVETSTGVINGLIDVESYDIGHYFTTGSGGRAYLSSVCGNRRGGGTTGLSRPIGDPFNVDFVAHEIGHQFGATHTFNGSTGQCSENRTSYTAYEPGSGSTVMGYAGICAPQNIQINSSDYFHQASLQQIWTNITEGNSTCGVLTATGNFAPIAEAGPSYVIPISTPYKLTGSSIDPDGTENHTYTWEQFDLGPVGLPTETTELGPMVRSFPGTKNPVRYIPKLQDVLSNGGNSTTWEKLASVERSHTFTLTVRDNDSRGGQTDVAGMEVFTDASAGRPFEVTSQTTNVTWEVGANKMVTWDVANTDVAPVNTPDVNIKLSVDGGATFPYTLAGNVPNDGSHEISVPSGTVTNQARIMIEGAGNIFYNVNTANFKIINVDFLLNFAQSSVTVCQPNKATYNFTYNTYGGYNQSTTFSATNLPAGTTANFSPASASVDGSAVTLSITTNGNITPGIYNLNATGTSGNKTNSSVVLLNMFSGTIAPIALVAPVNGADGLFSDVTLTWEDDINVEDYFVEISTTPNFDIIEDSQTLTTTSYITALQLETVYYWRVTGFNQCATSTTSSVNSFSTGVSTCGYSATALDTPIVISPTDSNIYNSTIVVEENLPVTGVSVKVNITHTWASDLKLVLISPTGTQIILAEKNGNDFEEDFINTVFDQEATTTIADASAPFTGTFIPKEDLSNMYGEMSAGNWTLQVTDLFDKNGGNLTEFTLDLCLAQTLTIDENGFDGFAIFPNPNTGEFTVKLKSASDEDIKLEVYDIRGRKVIENRFGNTGNFREVIRLDHARSGLYLIKISDGLKTVTKKILVK